MRKELAREVVYSQAVFTAWGIRLPHCINKWHGQARSLKIQQSGQVAKTSNILGEVLLYKK